MAASTPNGRPNRTGSSKAIVVLKLSSHLLSRFPNSSPNAKHTPVKAKPNATMNKATNNKATTASSPPVKEKEASPASSLADAPVPPSDNVSEANSMPAGAPSAETPQRKGGLPGPKTGSKRGHNQGDSAPKPRSKPGPKKRQKLDDGSTEQAKMGTGHRLGPKANTGAINAGLRALDRTGAPCRKWERKPLQLKSFTGVFWQLPSWRAPKPHKAENGETKETALDPAETDTKTNHDASGVPSEKSNSGDGDLTPVVPPMVEASSPAIPMAI